jgi:predicted DNA binding CopG/RHH family protein
MIWAIAMKPLRWNSDKSKLPMTPEEQDILESVEQGEWQSVPNLQQEIGRYQSYAKAQLGELQEIKVEIPSRDLEFLQTIATQTESSVSAVITHLLHQFVVQSLETTPNHDRPI